MKTILVPTDFSKISRNAIDYAVEIAKLTKSRLVLFHVFHVSMINVDSPFAVPSLVEIGKDCLEKLKKIEQEIHFKHDRNITIQCVCKCGFAVDEINQFIKDTHVDLVVMGTHGAGYLAEKFTGSVTTSLMRKATCPVLAIDQHVKFKTIRKIVLACDYHETNSSSVFDPLKEFAQLFESHVYVLNVVRELEMASNVSKTMAGIRLEHSLRPISHSFHYKESENVVEGINDFVKEKMIDLVVMIPHMHTVLHNIFQEPITKRMALHSQVPLLSLHP